MVSQCDAALIFVEEPFTFGLDNDKCMSAYIMDELETILIATDLLNGLIDCYILGFEPLCISARDTNCLK